ncbi:hypothetical protein MBLNU230_g4345t1 [Neophaeotheca triangularis]
MSPPTVKGCHLVGSVPLADEETVFRQCSAGLANRLKRIPDGETGQRINFTFWQYALFAAAAPQTMVLFEMNNKAPITKDFTPEEIDQGVAQLEAANIQTGYDTAAIQSYQTFKSLKDSAVLDPSIRFQVSIPTTPNIIGVFVQPAFRARVEPIYESALFTALRNIQAAIPHDQLSIQLDLAVDTAFWEGQYLAPWFDDVKDGVMTRINRLAAQVDPDVELGFHNCYGDMEHKHWYEPASTAAVVERGLRILNDCPHSVSFFHLPVPLSAEGRLDEYFAPLADLVPKLKAHGCELVLGLLHYGDLEGTRRRIEAAGKVAPEFAVASECGYGRTPPEQLEGIFDIAREVSEPVR